MYHNSEAVNPAFAAWFPTKVRRISGMCSKTAEVLIKDPGNDVEAVVDIKAPRFPYSTTVELQANQFAVVLGHTQLTAEGHVDL